MDVDNPRFELVPMELQFNNDGLAYWIPLFSVKSKGKARIFRDFAAITQKVCIYGKLQKVPDRNNKLLGVVHRFQLYPFVIAADVENMFINLPCQVNKKLKILLV